MQTLVLSANNLRKVPNLNLMTDLTVLDLSSNRLGLQSGAIKLNQMRLRNLRVLSLEHNNIRSKLPHKWSLPELRTLRLSDNRFEGTIPGTWQKMRNLHYVDLVNNRLYGTIPPELTSPSLTWHLEGNRRLESAIHVGRSADTAGVARPRITPQEDIEKDAAKFHRFRR